MLQDFTFEAVVIAGTLLTLAEAFASLKCAQAAEPKAAKQLVTVDIIRAVAVPVDDISEKTTGSQGSIVPRHRHSPQLGGA